MEEASNPIKRRIIITGPESTGKTALAESLSRTYNIPWIPEFARGYVESLNRPYNYQDVENIAREQIKQLASSTGNAQWTIFDTGLIITKVWFQVVFKEIPDWLIEAIHKYKPDLCLLCNTDLPWKPDDVRENGGPMREHLFHTYKLELKQFNIPFEVVSGMGNQRLQSARNALVKHHIFNV